MEMGFALLATFLGGAMLVKACRHENDDELAGRGIAAWTIIVAIVVAVGMAP